MNKKVLLVIVVAALVAAANTMQAQWKVYDCSLLPTEADTAWHEGGDTPDDVTTYMTIVDDPDITGNKLLKFDESSGSAKEIWRMNWNSDSNTGATLVFRCKGIDASVYDRDFDLYIYNGVVRERLVSNGGREIKFDKSKVAAAMNTLEWHIYRLTIIADYLEVYVDEDPLSYLSAQGEAATDNFFFFGDNGSSRIGSLYDWIIWDVSGAYPPGQGTPIPQDLLETGTSPISMMNGTTQSKGFQLAQNYPNPFNPTTEIEFDIGIVGRVKLEIYDINGRLVQTLVNEKKQPGTYRIQWNGRDSDQNIMPSGIYFYSLEAGSYKSVKKMTLLK